MPEYQAAYSVHTSFNRYMVECECWIPEAGERVIASFNRYMVECE